VNTPDPNKKPRRTTTLLPEVRQTARRASHNALQQLFHHLLSKPIAISLERPSEAQRNLVVTGFILGILSILTAIFPISGILTGICGLAIGIHSRRQSRALYTMASWVIGLSLAGLVLSLVITVITHH